MRKDVTGGYGASSSVWRSLPESEMCAVLVVVANILREPAFQVAFVNCTDVIQEIMPATPYPTLRDLHSAKDSRTRCGEASMSSFTISAAVVKRTRFFC